MFCTKCGNELDNDALFCTSCGNKVKKEEAEEKGQASENTINVSISSEKAKGFFKTIFKVLKSPTSYVHVLEENLNSKNNLILVIISLLLIPIINIISLKTVISNILISFGQLGSILEGRAISHLDSLTFKKEFGVMFDAVAPTGKIFMFNIIFYILLFTIISGIVFIGIKTSGNNLTFENLIRVLTLPVLILLLSSILSPLTLSVTITFSLIVSLILNGIFIVTLYNGFKSLAPSFELLPYIYSIAFVVGFLLTYYISFKMLLSDLVTTFMKFM